MLQRVEGREEIDVTVVFICLFRQGGCSAPEEEELVQRDGQRHAKKRIRSRDQLAALELEAALFTGAVLVHNKKVPLVRLGNQHPQLRVRDKVREHGIFVCSTGPATAHHRVAVHEAPVLHVQPL